jgi:rare lipoprotein A
MTTCKTRYVPLAILESERNPMRLASSWIVPLVLIATIGAWVTPARARTASDFFPGAVQVGKASWYGKSHDGHRTASGEIYDSNRLTAAHPNLPLGTRVLVTNLNNGRSVQVRVNDRGPTIRGRIIDLSYAGARRLGALADGIVPVKLRVLSTPSTGVGG